MSGDCNLTSTHVYKINDVAIPNSIVADNGLDLSSVGVLKIDIADCASQSTLGANDIFIFQLNIGGTSKKIKVSELITAINSDTTYSLGTNLSFNAATTPHTIILATSLTSMSKISSSSGNFEIGSENQMKFYSDENGDNGGGDFVWLTTRTNGGMSQQLMKITGSTGNVVMNGESLTLNNLAVDVNATITGNLTVNGDISGEIHPYITTSQADYDQPIVAYQASGFVPTPPSQLSLIIPKTNVITLNSLTGLFKSKSIEVTGSITNATNITSTTALTTATVYATTVNSATVSATVSITTGIVYATTVNATTLNSATLTTTGDIDVGNSSYYMSNYDGTGNSQFFGKKYSTANQLVGGMEIENTGTTPNYSQNLHFWTHTYGGVVSRKFTIKNNGRVGIGNQDPILFLDSATTNGTIAERGLRVGYGSSNVCSGMNPGNSTTPQLWTGNKYSSGQNLADVDGDSFTFGFGWIYSGANYQLFSRSNSLTNIVAMNVNRSTGAITNAAGGSFSDDRWKFNETNIINGLDTIMKLSPEIYDKVIVKPMSQDMEINDINSYKESGFIAQEVEEIEELKHLVLTAEDDYGLKSLNYSGIIPYNTRAIQELKLKNDELKNKVNELELKLNLIYDKLSIID